MFGERLPLGSRLSVGCYVTAWICALLTYWGIFPHIFNTFCICLVLLEKPIG